MPASRERLAELLALRQQQQAYEKALAQTQTNLAGTKDWIQDYSDISPTDVMVAEAAPKYNPARAEVEGDPTLLDTIPFVPGQTYDKNAYVQIANKLLPRPSAENVPVIQPTEEELLKMFATAPQTGTAVEAAPGVWVPPQEYAPASKGDFAKPSNKRKERKQKNRLARAEKP